MNNIADVRGNYQEGMQKIFLLRKEIVDDRDIYYLYISEQSEI